MPTPLSPSEAKPSRSAGNAAEVAVYFLRLGLTAFGGPAAHTAMMHEQAVVRRKWLDEQRFLDLLGAANLIPGPTSTELAIFIGYERAGWLGLILAGVCFLLPAMLIVLGLAWAYVRFGSAVQVGWLFYGIQPVVIAIILQALWKLGRKTIKSIPTVLVALAVIVLYLLGVNALILLLGGGLVLVAIFGLRSGKTPNLTGLVPTAWIGYLPAATAAAYSLPVLFLTFLKIGAVLYGGGYALAAFLRADFVVRLGWLTDRQLLDAIAVGQATPGPLFTTATFIGFLLGGLPGALLATLAIFLPSFVFVPIVRPLLQRLRNSPWASAWLDGVIVASLGLMAGVTWQLGLASLIDPFTILLAILAGVLLFKYEIHPTWLILGGAAAGIGIHLFH
jgi:chromate transporter